MNTNSITIEQLRQSTAEVLACALVDLFPSVQLIRGGATSYGFFYEAFFPKAIDQSYLPQLEERMRALVTEDHPIRNMTMMRQNAADLLHHKGQHLRAEQIAQGNSQLVELFQLNDFCDPAPLPYLQSTKEAAANKLLSITISDRSISPGESAAVTRIEGIVCFKKMDLKKQAKAVEEIKKRDHRLVGPRLELFAEDAMTAPGCILWLAKGTKLKNNLLAWWKKECENEGFQNVNSPTLVSPTLMQKAGFLRQEELSLPPLLLESGDYFPIPSLDMVHALQFKALGKKIAPTKLIECRELFSGIPDSLLDGLTHTRTFTADQATIFCKTEQATDELISSLQFIVRSIRIFDFECEWVLRVPDSAKFAKSENWQKAIKMMHNALEACGMNATVAEIQAPFQGPSIEASLVDALGCKWPGPRVAVNVLLPNRLGLILEEKTLTSTPTMITLSLFGALERFIALLIEHWEGNIPPHYFDSNDKQFDRGAG